MRIAYLWDADYPWDVRTEKVCAALTAAGHEVHVVARNRAWKDAEERLPEGTVHRMRPWRMLGRRLDGALSFPAFFSPRWLGLLARVVRRTRAELIVARDLPLCPAAIAVGRAFGLPVVFDMAENYPAMIRQTWDAGRRGRWDVLVRNPALAAAVERWCLPRVDRTLVVVEESGERLRRMGVPADRVAVVSNTPPRARAMGSAERPPSKDGVTTFVYLGLMEIPRGVGELIEGIAILRGEGEAVRLRLVGDGRDLDVFRARARGLGLSADVVEFTGRLPHDEALAAVASADVGVVPHHADEAWSTTIPNKLFDYMAFGLPVLSSDAPPPKRVLDETGAGLVFRSADADSLADAARRLLDPALRARMGAAGREAVRARYHWEADAAVLLRAVAAARGASVVPIPSRARTASPAVPGGRKLSK